jgi:hypothetical protein
MDPSKISLSDMNKLFEYEKLSREIDECEDLNKLRNLTKSYIKLYMKQQEVLADLEGSKFK